MPSLFWLALLLGYLVGVSAAVLTLPAPVIEPLYGKLALASAIVVGGMLGLSWWSRSGEPEPAEADAELHTGPAVPRAPSAASAERPASDDLLGDPSRLRLISVATEHGLTAAELREILYEGRVEVMVQPLLGLAGGAPLEHAVPRLRTADGRALEPAGYLSTAARCGLLGLIDQALVMRAAQAARQDAAAGRERRLVCGIGLAALRDPAFVTEIEALLAAEEGIAQRLVLEIDRLRLDRATERMLAALVEKGARIGLRRIASRAVDVAEIAERRIELVRLAGPLYALDPDHPAPGPQLRRLSAELLDAGATLVVGCRGASRQPLEVESAPLAADRQDVFARARADVA